MEYFDKQFCIEVAGEYACFTRPEMKVERMSYDVITPSAARGIFQAIFWKPAVQWRIRRIDVLKPVRWTSVRRNEVGSTMSERSPGLYVEDTRQQRAALILRDVAYRLYADLEFIPPAKRAPMLERDESVHPGKDENPGKYNAMFERRIRKGQCFNQPYLGTREFSCSFRLVEHPETEPPPADETRDLGFVLYDLDFTDPNDIRPAFFRANLEQGVLIVPPWESEEVKR